MNTVMDILIILGLFLLRLGVPLAITILLGYLLHRLDARWQEEAQAYAHMPVEQDGKPTRPATTPPWAPALTAKEVFGQPCWQLKDCAPAKKASCPAVQDPAQPCWLARSRALGRLPAACQECEIYAALVPYEDSRLDETRFPGRHLPSSGDELYH